MPSIRYKNNMNLIDNSLMIIKERKKLKKCDKIKQREKKIKWFSPYSKFNIELDKKKHRNTE